jgi:phosphoribosyl-ATP pyrophosphohydrolase/phosphoribosyl-AMP cyclohydrolase
MTKLIPVVVQDVDTNNVLMLAYANGEALRKTKKTGYMHYWSRSRNALWKKGETSGHFQKVVKLLKDCDHDTILARVKQTGPACHRKTYSCFAKKPILARGVLDALWATLQERKRKKPRGSYTVKLLKNKELRLKKMLEEAAELALARKRKDIIWEAADLVYHMLVVLTASNITLEDVEKELARRFK